MKKFVLIIISIIVCMGLSSCTKNESVKKENQNPNIELKKSEKPPKILKIGISEWKPYTSETMEKNGFLSELAMTTLENAGYKIEIKKYDWEEALKLTKEGKIDGIIGSSHVEERKKWAVYPDVLWVSELSFYKKIDDKKEYTSLKDLAPSSIGVFKGSFVREILKDIENINIVETDDMNDNIKKLASGEIDYFLDSKDAIQYSLSHDMKEFSNKIKIMNPSFQRDDLYIIFSKETIGVDKIIIDFNRELKKIKEEGTYDKIVKKSGLDEIYVDRLWEHVYEP